MRREMTEYEEALKMLNEIPEIKKSEEVPLECSNGRVLAKDVLSTSDFPPFNRAAMDGFAFRHEDLNKVKDAIFKVKDVILAGHPESIKLGIGECVRIMTGGEVPSPCDTVIELESCEEKGDKVKFLKYPPLRFNVAVKGEDLKVGKVALKKGTRISPKHMNLLASLGLKEVEVKKKIRVGVLSSGDELVEIGEKLGKGKIRNSSKYSLFSQVIENDQEYDDLGTVRDDEDEIFHAIEVGMERDDIVLITGGSSAGDKDYTLKVLERLNARILTRQIAIKPGRPTIMAKVGEKWIVGMPGNPVSTFIVFKLFVSKMIGNMIGTNLSPVLFRGELNFDFKKKGDRIHFVPCKVDVSHVPLINPLSYNGSGDFTALSRADAFFLAPKGETLLKKGRQVEFFFV